MTKAKLFQRIEAFIAERSKSQGGYAPVDGGDVDALSTIIDGLIRLKYQADPDGAYPLEYLLVDRTRHERPFVLPVPYTHRTGADDQASELDAVRQAIGSHATMARAHSDSVHRLLQSQEDMLRKATETHAPIAINGVEYRKQLPPSVTEETVQKRLQAELERALAKQGWPQGHEERRVWASNIAQVVSRKLVPVVNANLTIAEDWSVHMYVDVPALGKRVRARLPAA